MRMILIKGEVISKLEELLDGAFQEAKDLNEADVILTIINAVRGNREIGNL